MAAYRELPEQVLSRNTARYLITRNAGEKELLRRTSFLLDKAKSEEEKDFERERARLLLRRSKIQEIQTPPAQVKFNVGRNILCRNEEETEKWKFMTDKALFIKNRRKRGMLLNNKTQGQAWKRSATSFGCTLPAIQPSRTAVILARKQSKKMEKY